MNRGSLHLPFFVCFVCCFLSICSCATPISFVEKDDSAAYRAAMEALARHDADRASWPEHVAVVDFTQPSCLRRMAIYNLRSGGKKTYLAAHAANTGDMNARDFSNALGSEMSSLGLFKAGAEYVGRHGRSLRLHGLEKGLNDNAYERRIVLHAADYVTPRAMTINLLCGYGPRIGRSNGCFVISPSAIDEVVEVLKEDGFLYAYHEAAVRPGRNGFATAIR